MVIKQVRHRSNGREGSHWVYVAVDAGDNTRNGREGAGPTTVCGLLFANMQCVVYITLCT